MRAAVARRPARVRQRAVSNTGAAVGPTFEDSALVLDVATDGGGFAISMVQGNPAFELSDVRVSAMLLELPQNSSSVETGFLFVPDNPTMGGIGFEIDEDSVEVTESMGFVESTVLGSIPLSRVQLPLRLDFTIAGGTFSAGVSGPAGEELIYEGPTPDGFAEYDIALLGVNPSDQDPTGVARFDFIEACPI